MQQNPRAGRALLFSRQFWPLWGTAAGLWLGIAVLFYGIRRRLPYGTAYRSWFARGGAALLFCGACGMLLVLALVLPARAARTARSPLASACLHALSAVLFLLLAAVLCAGLWLLPRLIPAEQLQTDGTLLAGGSLWYAEGPFLRRSAADSTGSRAAGSGAGSAADSAGSAAGTPDSTARQISLGYAAILRQAYPTADPVYTADAKGNPYVVISDDGTTRVRLVYDRPTANGACLQYVCYQDQMSADAQGGRSAESTAILDFYAVDTAHGSVYAAGKTSWDGTADSAYRAATGE